MPITQSLNSKANIKKVTNNDIPFSPAQPVIANYSAVSTAGQTVINLTFSVDTVNNPTVFFLFVDGKKLVQGSSNDFTFTSIAADGTSSQVTLRQALAVNQNIEAYKLGLKPEIAFGTDNRFVAAYAALDSGFQGFISQTDAVITATTTTGAPAAGKFYSTITGRASMPDLSQDLKPRMGVERVMTQTAFLLQSEFGPNNEPIWALPNDLFGQIRFGGQWTPQNDQNGVHITSSVSTDFLEITFYGTGLNILYFVDGNNRNWTQSVDGGSFTSGTSYPGTSGIGFNNARNYGSNTVLNVVTGLTLGIHTVKMIFGGAQIGAVFGFDILNESSSVKTTPGIGYIKAQKYTSSSLSSFVYSAPATGTRGGRTLIYQNADGSIGTAFQAVNASAQTLTSADHTNEEVVRSYYFREFGAGRSDDYSRETGSGTYAFTLEDNTTTLQTTGSAGGTSILNGYEAMAVGGANGAFTTFTFVGTGLDIMTINNANGGADTFTVSIDGAAGVNIQTTGSTALRQQKVVSGLPYGTHVVKFTRTSTPTTYDMYIRNFIVYQPKKPTLPSGSIELADYNVMANYSFSSATAFINGPSTGVLGKSVIREVLYTGSGWSVQGVDSNSLGVPVRLSASGDALQITFFGTGIEVSQSGSAGTLNVQMDGANFSGTSAVTGAGASFSVATWNTGNAVGTLSLSGLTLGTHVLKITANSANTCQFDSFQIITPIHSAKSTLYGDLQNTLPVGSSGISDNRKITPVKDVLPATKSWAQALNTTGGSTTSTVFVPVPFMSVTISTGQSVLDLSFFASAANATTNTLFQFYVDGVAVGIPVQYTGNINIIASHGVLVPVSKGVHKVDLYWASGNGSGIGLNSQGAIIKVKEL